MTSTLRLRIITGCIIAPIALACVFLLPPFEFSLFVAAVITVGAWEWGNLGGLSQPYTYVYALIVAATLASVSIFLFPLFLPILYASLVWWFVALIFVLNYPSLTKVWGQPFVILLIGMMVLLAGFVALVEIKKLPESNYLICMLFFLIWGADIGAYFSGKAFGRRKLAPRVSPGKSWAGFYGGLLIATLIALGMSIWWGKPALMEQQGYLFILACGLIAILSVLGDLTISMFKRHRDIKDTSNLLPGHGGILDRIDSLLSAAPAFAIVLNWANWV